ncbi:hypothetical protein BUY37_13025, partial [Staphylococcus cohnii]|uniref:hypothetical protein n=1 Tax=Staphylococcus cohnii TaxID=29382 RepID=UPI000FF682C8
LGVTTANFEFLDIHGNLIAVIKVEGFGVNNDNYYGPSYSSLTLATKSTGLRTGATNGFITFESTGVRFTKNLNETNSFFIACDCLAVKSVKLSNVRVYVTAFASDIQSSVIFQEATQTATIYGLSTPTLTSVVDGLCSRSGLASGEY